jgi:hypothetical protein
VSSIHGRETMGGPQLATLGAIATAHPRLLQPARAQCVDGNPVQPRFDGSSGVRRHSGVLNRACGQGSSAGPRPLRMESGRRGLSHLIDRKRWRVGASSRPCRTEIRPSAGPHLCRTPVRRQHSALRESPDRDRKSISFYAWVCSIDSGGSHGQKMAWRSCNLP